MKKYWRIRVLGDNSANRDAVMEAINGCTEYRKNEKGEDLCYTELGSRRSAIEVVKDLYESLRLKHQVMKQGQGRIWMRGCIITIEEYEPAFVIVK